MVPGKASECFGRIHRGMVSGEGRGLGSCHSAHHNHGTSSEGAAAVELGLEISSHEGLGAGEYLA